MDGTVIIELPASREVLRDHKGSIIGTMEPQRLTGKVIARDARGVLLGIYDPRSNETRDARGRVVARGNLLGGLILRWR